MKVLLYSGGLDSTLVALMERPDALLFIDWGQKAAKYEWQCCKWWAERYLKVPLFKLRIAPLQGDYSYIPARNLNFVVTAVNWAVVNGYDEVLLGIKDGDLPPDTKPIWVKALNLFFSVIEPLPVTIRAPLHEVNYDEILREYARTYPLMKTFSCSLLNRVPCNKLPENQWCCKCKEKKQKISVASCP